MLGSALPIRYESFEDRLSRESNRGVEPFLDLVERRDEYDSLIFAVPDESDERPERRRRRVRPPK